MSAQDRVLKVLKSRRKKGVSSVELRAMASVCNAPDAVRKLRRKGHVILTARRDVKWQFRMYPNIGVYIYKGKTK